MSFNSPRPSGYEVHVTLCFRALRRLSAGLLFLALFLVSARARADHAIALALHGDPLPAERVRTAISRELAHDVELGETSESGVVTITWRKSAGELAVTWDGPKRTVSRVVAARSRVDPPPVR